MAIAWSFSHIKSFETCPRKYDEEMVSKNYPFVESAASKYGNEVHKALELYVKDGKKLDGNMRQFKKVADKLLSFNGEKIAERKQALNFDREPTSYFAKDVWVRGISDLTIINGNKAKVFDYKTGSAKYPDTDQLELMALITFAYHPEVEHVRSALLFLHHSKLVPAEFHRDDIDKLWDKWDKKYKKLKAARVNKNFPPNPNGLCRKWCPVKHCEFNGD